MIIGRRHLRLEEAIQYLAGLGKVDGANIVKSISEKMDRHPNNVRAALRGEERFLTFKFVKTFCSTYESIISPDWIWNGTGKMIAATKGSSDFSTEVISDESLDTLTREELVHLVKELMDLHREQTNMYNLLIRQNEEMIRNGQERFNKITSIIQNVNQ